MANKNFQDKIDKELARLDAQRLALLQKAQFLTQNSTDDEADFITKPISEYGDYENQIAKYNPDLMVTSKKYDDLISKSKGIEDQMLNLTRAKDMMVGSVEAQKAAVNKAANASTKGTALSKALQVGAAQGTAGNQGASAGQINKVQSDISNQFAPKFADIEAQRQAGLGQATQLEASIPTNLSGISGQNVTNKYNQALTNKTRQGTPRSSTLTIPSTNTVIPAGYTKDAKTGQIVPNISTQMRNIGL